MRCLALILSSALFLMGCGTNRVVASAAAATIDSVLPSSAGIPNTVIRFGDFEFVSVQGTGQIFTYNVASGAQVLVGSPYATPCADPSGMVIATIAGANVMAAACYDTGTLLTLTVHADGTLSALGSMSGLPRPYPGIVLDGTNVLVPLFGQSLASNGGVAKVSIARPTDPLLIGVATLASPVPGGFANPAYLAVVNGYIFVVAGSESYPQAESSTIQVVNEATMAVVGTPLVTTHSPQQIAVQGNVAYVTLYDAGQLESIDISNPANLQVLQVLPLEVPACHPVPVMVSGRFAYIGCYAEDSLEQFDISTPTAMKLTRSLAGIASPQRITADNGYLLVPSSTIGGRMYEIGLGALQ